MGLCGQAFLTRVSPMTCAHLLGTPTTPGTLCSQMLPDELIFLFFFIHPPDSNFKVLSKDQLYFLKCQVRLPRYEAFETRSLQEEASVFERIGHSQAS